MGLFDIFEIRFWKTTEGHRGTQRDTERVKDENNNSMGSLWFNLPYHGRILRKGEKVCALANYQIVDLSPSEDYEQGMQKNAYDM